MGEGGDDQVPKVLRHFLPKYCVNIWILGLFKSYLTVVQNGPIQELPHGCPKWGGGVEATFGQCPKERRFFMASLRGSILSNFHLSNWNKATYCTVWTVHRSLHTACCKMYTVHFILYTVHCTLYTEHCTLYNVDCTLYTVHCTVFIVHCTLYTVHCTLYIIKCTLDIVQCTRYNM